MSQTQKRRTLLRQIVRTTSVSTQQELVERLQEKGVPATQASISRDIAALGLVKAGGIYSAPAETVPTERMSKDLSGRVHSVAKAGDSMIVLKTDPGLASALALMIDSAKWPSVVGTIAGDDTVFVATNGKQEQKSALKSIAQVYPELGIEQKG